MNGLAKKAVLVSAMAAMILSLFIAVTPGYFPSPETVSQMKEGLHTHPDMLISREWSLRGGFLVAGPSGSAFPLCAGLSPRDVAGGARSVIPRSYAAGGANSETSGRTYLDNSHLRC